MKYMEYWDGTKMRNFTQVFVNIYIEFCPIKFLVH